MSTISVELPNGVVIDDVPLGTSKTELMRKAVNAGLATYQDFAEKLDPTAGMGFGDKLLAGAGKAFTDVYRGAQQLAAGDQDAPALQAQIDEAARLDKPLMNTGAGIAGNVLGNAAPAALLAFVPGANTVAGSAALGGLTSALQPVETGGSRASNAIVGTALGGAGQVLGNVAPNALRAIAAPFTESGRQRIVADTLRRFSPDIEQRLAAGMTQPQIPGAQFNLAQATQDPGIAVLTRSAGAAEPQTAAALAKQDMGNVEAARAALRGIAGDDATRQAAVVARKQATAPLYDAVAKSDEPVNTSRVVNLIDRVLESRPGNKALTTPLKEIRETLFEAYPADQRGRDAWKVLDDVLQGRNAGAPGSTDMKAARTALYQLKTGAIGADDALAQLRAIEPKGKQFTEALDLAKQYVTTPDYVVRQNPQHIQSAIDNIKALLNKADNATVKRELTLIKNSLSHQLSKAAPEYGQAERTFAQMSQPINQMDIGTALYEKATPALADTADVMLPAARANQYAEALRNASSLVRNATGRRNMALEDIMSPDQMGTLQGVQDLFARRAAADQLARGPGSNTAQNLSGASVVRSVADSLIPGLSRLADSSLGQSLLNGPVGLFYKGGAEPRIQQALAEALLSPQAAQDALKGASPSELKKLADALYRRGLPAFSGSLGADAASQ